MPLDFLKAFDTIDHDLMNAKLIYYGFGDISISFFNSYLIGRYQRIRISNLISDLKSICSGVPQESSLCPLLFLVYTADIFFTLRFSIMQAYADDI